MTQKKCFKCGVVKSLTEFYEHARMVDGHLNKCKICAKIDVAENYRTNRKHYQEYERKRLQNPDRKHNVAKYQKSGRRKNPARAKAYQKLHYALRAGKVVRQPCYICGNTKSQGHHKDYSKPLNVEWLCFKCHRENKHGQIVG